MMLRCAGVAEPRGGKVAGGSTWTGGGGGGGGTFQNQLHGPGSQSPQSRPIRTDNMHTERSQLTVTFLV